MEQEVLDAIKRSGAVPSMPQVVARFLEIIQQPDFEYDDIVKVLSGDPGTTADVLRLSNSALFGVSRKITSLKQAITLLGPRRVRSLVLGRFMVEAVGKKDIGEFDAAYYWRRSLAAGVLSARMAERCMGALREEAFVAALLADIGIAILAQEKTQEYTPVLRLFGPHGEVNLIQAEVESVGVTHSRISSVVLEHWHLPALITEAVAHHQAPGDEDESGMQLARIICAADQIAKLLCESPNFDRLPAQCERATSALNLDLSMLLDMLPKVQEDIADLAEVLRVDVIPASSYELMSKAINAHLTTQAAP